MKIKKYSCIIIQENGTQETKDFEAASKRVLKKILKKEGVQYKKIREHVKIKGGVIWLVILGSILVPAAGYAEEPYMSLNLVGGVAMIWTINLLFRNPKKAIVPGIIAAFLLTTVGTVLHDHVAELEKMKPEGNTIVAAIDHYRENAGHYPEELENLVPQYLTAVPDDPFHYRYMVFSEESYSLSVRIPPFRIYYDWRLKQWYRPPPS